MNYLKDGQALPYKEAVALANLLIGIARKKGITYLQMASVWRGNQRYINLEISIKVRREDDDLGLSIEEETHNDERHQ